MFQSMFLYHNRDLFTSGGGGGRKQKQNPACLFVWSGLHLQLTLECTRHGIQANRGFKFTHDSQSALLEAV